MKPIALNLFGPPGSGKSSGFGTIFGYLKNRGGNVEMTPEQAKPMVYAQRQAEMKNQILMFSRQYQLMHDIAEHSDVALIITDSPILLGTVYANSLGLYYKELLEALIYCVHETEFENVNVFVKRVKPYNPSGRNQTEEESNELISDIRGLVNFDYEINGDEEGQLWLAKEIMERFGDRILLPSAKKEQPPIWS